MNNPQPGQGRGPAPTTQTAGRGGFAKALFAQAAAWAPNPMNPPQYFDLPEKDGQIQPLVAAKWVANSPLVMVDQYVPSLRKYRAIALDVGLQDGLLANNQDLDQALTRLGIPHTFETYEGTHTSRVKERFVAKVLPFFSANLTFSEARPAKAK
jgi:S-formylglutathione hydrolase FrmB